MLVDACTTIVADRAADPMNKTSLHVTGATQRKAISNVHQDNGEEMSHACTDQTPLCMHLENLSL